MTDRELKQLVSNSREDGFKALFQQYQSYVYKIIWERLRFIGSSEDAEECISDIFLQVFLHFDEIQEGSLKAYIGTVAKNKSIDYVRKKKTASEKYADVQQELLHAIPSDENIEQDMETAFESQRLYQNIRKLGEPDATIVILKYFYDKKSKDIAKQVHLSPIAVRVRLNRALKKLRLLLDEM